MNTTIEKKLRALTIIPESLYVRRAADEQLKGVVANMGRPGYVLVARQMGKTNLLLNAKRELSGKNDVFLYVDLSNAFPTLQQFFRNIIDTAVETHPQHFALLQADLEARRVLTNSLPAHKEHEQELRMLLNAIVGKIVICLDEIDALTKSNYSDSVFSLIRSTYFASRINFSEFNRLTYILSGVAEPTELIKNKDISPFNIGEKIYLDDFSYDEYLRFIEKAELSLSEDVRERIFYWTNGNPRMCWDLCSALEDIEISGREVDVGGVDQTVRRLYLTSYDIAPVDHIRQLVEDDKDIRNAIMSIHYKKYSAISDVHRTRLYLSGVIKADFLSDSISIKNKIIEESLSEDWINSVENLKLSIRDRANKKLEERDYETALDLFRACDDGKIGADKVYLYHNMGECYFRMGEYSEAIDYLTRAPAKKSSFAMLFFRQQIWLGVAQFRIGDIHGSIERLNAVVNADFAEGRTTEYFEALVNRCAPYFKQFEEFGQAIIDDCTYVIEHAHEATGNEIELKNTLVCAAYLNLAEALRRLKRDEDAVVVLREAIGAVTAISQPSLIVQLVDAVPEEERAELLLEAARLIEEHQLSFTDDLLQEHINFSERVYAELLTRALELADQTVWKATLAPLIRGRFSDTAKKGVLSNAIVLALRSRKRGIVKHLLRAFIDNIEDNLKGDEFRALGYYVIVVDDEEDVDDIEREFVASFTTADIADLGERDIVTMYVIAEKAFRADNVSFAQRTIDAVNENRGELSRLDSEPRISQALFAIDFAQLLLIAKKNDRIATENFARALRKIMPEEVASSSAFAPEFFYQIKAELDAILSIARPVPVKAAKKYGRNDLITCRYLDGSIKQGKYKHLEKELKEGKCEVVSNSK